MELISWEKYVSSVYSYKFLYSAQISSSSAALGTFDRYLIYKMDI